MKAEAFCRRFFLLPIDNLYPYGYNVSIPRGVYKEDFPMQKAMDKLEELLELGGTKKDIVQLIISAFSLLASIFRLPLQFLRQGYIIS